MISGKYSHLHLQPQIPCTTRSVLCSKRQYGPNLRRHKTFLPCLLTDCNAKTVAVENKTLNVTNNKNSLFADQSMKNLLLMSIIAVCACFHNEHDLVNIVNDVKNFFYSGCIFFLRDEERGK